MSTESLIKVRIVFEQPAPFASETLWAYPRGEDLYQLANDPLDPQYSYGQVVVAKEEDGFLTVQKGLGPLHLLPKGLA